MKKIILINDNNKTDAQVAKEAKALAIKMPQMADATVFKGFKGAEDAVEGAIVLAEYLPNNIAAKAALFIECSTPAAITQSVKEVLPADEIAKTMQFVRAWAINEKLDTKKWFSSSDEEEKTEG